MSDTEDIRYHFELKNTSVGADYTTQQNLYELLLKTDLEAVDDPLYQIISSINAKIVEQQDQIILDTIRRIGDTVYHDLTFDRSKVWDMLKKYKAEKVQMSDKYPYELYCPSCAYTLARNGKVFLSIISGRSKNDVKYCSNCGQKLDWSDYMRRKVNGMSEM